MFLTQGGKELEREYSEQAVKDLIVCVHLIAKDNEKLYLPLLTHARFKLDMHIQILNIKNNLENKLGSPGGLIKLGFSRDIVTKSEDTCGILRKHYCSPIILNGLFGQ